RVPQAVVQRRHRAPGRPGQHGVERAGAVSADRRRARGRPGLRREAVPRLPRRQMKVLAERDGPVLTVTLNRPDKLNALDADCLDLLERHFAEADADPAVRAVVLAGKGRGFCAGADLAVVAGIAADRDAFDAFLRR